MATGRNIRPHALFISQLQTGLAVLSRLSATEPAATPPHKRILMTRLANRIELLSIEALPEASGRDLLLCLSHLRWNFVWQRPQHLMTRAAAHYDVLFWEEPLWEEGKPRLRMDYVADGITVCTPVLPHGMPSDEAAEVQRRMLDETLAAQRRRSTTLWFYTPMALAFAGHLTADLYIYDCMDELSAFRGAPPEMLEREQDLLGRADLVFTGGRSLYEAKRHRHPDVHAFPSSIDKAHFAQARQLRHADPTDQKALARPRIGFCGVIDERMDIDLLASLAASEPDWQFVMLGPVVKIDPAALPRPDNIHWLGMKRYEELPAYIAGWDVALMPFAMNEATRFISPTKTPEFLAAGIPVVSTPVRDVVTPYGEQGLVGIAGDLTAARKQIHAALRRPRKTWLKDVDRFLADMSWDSTFNAMHRLMRGGGSAAESTGRDVSADQRHV
jgi:glycosyltransferase involved in cell wall biosynthesis